MIFRTPYLGRARGFLHFGFTDEDENGEIQDTPPSGGGGVGRLRVVRNAEMQDPIAYVGQQPV